MKCTGPHQYRRFYNFNRNTMESRKLTERGNIKGSLKYMEKFLPEIPAAIKSLEITMLPPTH